MRSDPVNVAFGGPWRGRNAPDPSITALAFRDNSFDLVICNHVFEHIPDDRAAMRELFRVCKVDGIALVSVPYDAALDHTYEVWSITTPEGRRKAFGQYDHVRTYSPGDYVRRVSDAGWTVTRSEEH